MREPGTGAPDWNGPKHFLTDWYTNLFHLDRIPFINYCGEGYYCFYGQPKIRMDGETLLIQQWLMGVIQHFIEWKESSTAQNDWKQSDFLLHFMQDVHISIYPCMHPCI